MDNHCRAKIYFNNKLTHYGKSNMVGYYHGEITVYHPLCSHAQQERERDRERRRRSFLMVCLEARALGSSAGPKNSAGRCTGTCHLECEAAGVILRDTVR